MNSRHQVPTTCASVLASVALGALLVTGPPARAGLIDQSTGEACWGAGCVEGSDGDLPDGPSGGGGQPSVSLPPNVTTEDCSDADSRRIGDAVTWLKSNIPAITAKMAQSPDLMSWPGNSRENFEDKLDKPLKFHCIGGKAKCGDLLGITYPVFAQSRVNLCSTQIDASRAGDSFGIDALYVHVVAHEIGHLIRLNTHKAGCIARYTDGSFSDALGFAAEYAFRNLPYDPAAYDGDCPGLTPEPFSLDDKLNNMERPVQVLK
ncbi:MAG TPA: hypothetical protein PKA13_16895 [Geminicoccaceae bacterium]|nr:hypothetical protein [Geminicoccus sp.]HMU51455.1 hypothetical protein [Geminicoccaceae bacterium]